MRFWLSGLLLVSLLGAIYGLVYNGVPLTDDEQLYAGAAFNVARSGAFGAGELYGNQRLQGHYYGIGPLHVAIGAVVVKLADLGGVGRLQALYWLPPLYFSLTAFILLALTAWWGYSLRAGVFTALWFCLGSMAFPYVRMFLREPLAGLLLAVAWLCFEVATSAQRVVSTRGRLMSWLGFMLSVSGLLLVEETLALALPLLALMFVWRWRKTKLLTVELQKTFAKMLLISLAGGFIFVLLLNHRGIPAYWSNRLSDESMRLGLERIRMINGKDLVGALSGALLSPAKGFFVYSPVTILALVSTVKYAKKQGRLIFPWALMGAVLLLHVLIYGDVWWTVTWGTRFLLPCLPLIVLTFIPLLEDLMEQGKRAAWIWVGLLAAFAGSFLIQLGGVLVADSSYLMTLYQQNLTLYPDLIWRVDYAPLWGHWKLLLNGGEFDLAAWRNWTLAPRAVMTFVSAASLLGLAAGWGLYSVLVDKNALGKRHILSALVLLSLSGFALPVWALSVYRDDPRYETQRADLAQAEDWVKQHSAEGDVMVVRSYLYPVWYYWMNFYRGEVPWYSLPIFRPAEQDGVVVDELENGGYALFETLTPHYQRIILLCEFFEPDAHPARPERYLSSKYRLAQEINFLTPDQEAYIRVVIYDIP